MTPPTLLGNAMQSLIDQLLARRHFLALVTVVCGSAVAWGVGSVTTDNTINSLLSEDDPKREQIEQVWKDFPPTTGVLFAFSPASGNVFDLETLLAMEDLTNRYSEIGSAVSVGSLLNYRLNAVDADRFGRDYLVPDLSTIGQDGLDEIREIALDDGDLTKSMLSPEGDMALAFIKYKVSTDDQVTRLGIARTVVSLRDSLRESHPEMAIHVIGRVLFELDSRNAQIKDSRYLFPLVIGASILLMWFCLRSLSYSLCLFVISFVTIGLTVGTIGWVQITLNQISAMGPLVVFTIAMADSIHLVSIYIQGLHESLSKAEAMRQSLEVNLQPISLATITTAMGFLSLNYCSSPAIYGFGNVVAIGVCWAYVVTLTLLPTLVLLMPTRKVPKPLGVRWFISGVSRLVAQHGNRLFWASVVLIATTMALLPLNKVDFNRFSFIDRSSDFHHVMKALSEKIGNDQSLAFSVRSEGYFGITEPDFLNQVDALSRWLEDQPEASFVTSYTDLLKTLNKAEHDNDERWNKLPEDKLQIIDHLVGYQLIQEIEPNLEPIFDSEFSAIRLVVGTSNLSNLELVEFNDRIEQWIATHLNPKYSVRPGDSSILFARLDQSISLELLKGFTLSSILITLTLLIGLRSVRYGLLSIMPNLFPATIVFGFWGLFVGELSPYILMLFSISIGLVVDDSVHILSKYISARRENKSPEEAVQYSLDKAGQAITITTVSLSLGTFILLFSNTFYYQNVAQLLTPIILVALLLDLLFLPPLLMKFDNWLEPRKYPGASTEASR
jgi:predicted RND superfamily exporter protein